MEELNMMPRPQDPGIPDIRIDALRRELGAELKSAAQSFIRIGYLLRVAKDSNTLYGSGYRDIYDFAFSEFGLDKSQVSRFMRINERFSEGGYSDRLLERYENFGSSKLAEMLLLPEAVAEELPPEASKAEIRAVVGEIQEEQKITDIEVALEPKPADPNEPLVCTAFREYFRENPDEYVSLAESLKEPGGKDVDKLLDVLAPSGIAMKMVRVSGIGRVMVSIKGAKEPVTVTNVRQNEKESMSLSDMAQKIAPLLEDVIEKGYPARVAWEQLYGKRFPGGEEIADAEEKTAGSQEASGEEEKHKKQGIVDIAKPKEKEKKTGRKAADQKAAGTGGEKKQKKTHAEADGKQDKVEPSGKIPAEAGQEEDISEMEAPHGDDTGAGNGACGNIHAEPGEDGGNVHVEPEEDGEESVKDDQEGDCVAADASHALEAEETAADEAIEDNTSGEAAQMHFLIGRKESLYREADRLHRRAGEALHAGSFSISLRHIDNMRDAVLRLIELEKQESMEGQMTIDGYMKEIEEL